MSDQNSAQAPATDPTPKKAQISVVWAKVKESWLVVGMMAIVIILLTAILMMIMSQQEESGTYRRNSGLATLTPQPLPTPSTVEYREYETKVAETTTRSSTNEPIVFSTVEADGGSLQFTCPECSVPTPKTVAPSIVTTKGLYVFEMVGRSHTVKIESADGRFDGFDWESQYISETNRTRFIVRTRNGETRSLRIIPILRTGS